MIHFSYRVEISLLVAWLKGSWVLQGNHHHANSSWPSTSYSEGSLSYGMSESDCFPLAQGWSGSWSSVPGCLLWVTASLPLTATQDLVGKQKGMGIDTQGAEVFHFRREWDRAENEVIGCISPCPRSEAVSFPTPLALPTCQHSTWAPSDALGLLLPRSILQARFMGLCCPTHPRVKRTWPTSRVKMRDNCS